MTEERIKLTQQDLDVLVKGEQYYRFPGTSVTVCCIELQNGYRLVGYSSCVHPDTFDEEVGKNVAHGKAIEQLWLLEGYLLKERLYQEGKL